MLEIRRYSFTAKNSFALCLGSGAMWLESYVIKRTFYGGAKTTEYVKCIKH